MTWVTDEGLIATAGFDIEALANAKRRDRADALLAAERRLDIARAAAEAESYQQQIQALERERDRILLEAALAASEGHRGQAAEKLGLGRNTLTRKLGASRTRRRRDTPGG